MKSLFRNTLDLPETYVVRNAPFEPAFEFTVLNIAVIRTSAKKTTLRITLAFYDKEDTWTFDLVFGANLLDLTDEIFEGKLADAACLHYFLFVKDRS